MHFHHMPSDATIRSLIAELENSIKGQLQKLIRGRRSKSENFPLNLKKLKVANKLCICSAVFCPRRFSVCVWVCV